MNFLRFKYIFEKKKVLLIFFSILLVIQDDDLLVTERSTGKTNIYNMLSVIKIKLQNTMLSRKVKEAENQIISDSKARP